MLFRIPSSSSKSTTSLDTLYQHLNNDVLSINMARNTKYLCNLKKNLPQTKRKQKTNKQKF